jgi:DNA polymerase-3 subunit delta'
MKLAEAISQESAKEVLRSFVEADRLPHAMLLLGPEGSGKLALALAFAQYVNCTNRRKGDSCGECANCRRSSQLAHPDLHFSFPTVGPKASSSLFLEQWRQMIRQSPYFSVNDWLQFIGAENKQGNITKEECVQIVKKLSLKASANDYKILLMWMPEYLGKEGNRLLKLIEEPPENTLFILVAERQELILNTILSRCQLVQTPGLTDEMVRTGLQHLLKVDKEQAEQFARLASGNLTEGLKLAQQSEGNHARLFLQWMRICYRGQAAELVEWANGLSKKNRAGGTETLLAVCTAFFARADRFLQRTAIAQIRRKKRLKRLKIWKKCSHPRKLVRWRDFLMNTFILLNEMLIPKSFFLTCLCRCTD